MINNALLAVHYLTLLLYAKQDLKYGMVKVKLMLIGLISTTITWFFTAYQTFDNLQELLAPLLLIIIAFYLLQKRIYLLIGIADFLVLAQIILVNALIVGLIIFLGAFILSLIFKLFNVMQIKNNIKFVPALALSQAVIILIQVFSV